MKAINNECCVELAERAENCEHSLNLHQVTDVINMHLTLYVSIDYRLRVELMKLHCDSMKITDIMTSLSRLC